MGRDPVQKSDDARGKKKAPSEIERASQRL